MEWEPWPYTEKRTLARYANPLAAALIPAPPDGPGPFDLLTGPEGKRAALRMIYERLAGCGIHYTLEPFSYQPGLQIIRQPADIFSPPREATCLDLALLVSGVCLHYELLPLLVMFRGHAIVAVSARHSRRDAEQGERDELHLFDHGLLDAEQAPRLRELVERGAYLALECTGVACSASLNARMPEGRGREGGRMSFDRALEAGREQFNVAERPLLYALDIHEIQRSLPPIPLARDVETQHLVAALPQHIEALRERFAVPLRTTSRVAVIKRQAWQHLLEARAQEYDAVMRNITMILDPVTEVRLGRQVKALEQEMEKIEQELSTLDS